VLKAKIWLCTILVGVFLLAACSESKEQEEANAVEESAEITDYIGEKIDVKEDGSIELPFDDQVLAAAYSEDGEIKLFAFDDYIIIVEGEEIIHVNEEAAPEHHLESGELAVSEDGRFATWKIHKDEVKIGVFDVENREDNIVESEDDLILLNIFSPNLIEKHGDTYYLMTNDYWSATGLRNLDNGSINVVDLSNLEIKNDKETIKKVTPEQPIEDDNMYHELKADAAELGMDDGHYSDYGYYKYFYEAEEPEEDDRHDSLTMLYGADVEKSELKEIKLEDLEFGKDEIHVISNIYDVDTQQIQLADNGMVILPIVNGDLEENNFTFRIYIVDLTEDVPLATLVTEEEVTDVRPSVFFNEDETAIYVSKEGELEKFVVKE